MSVSRAWSAILGVTDIDCNKGRLNRNSYQITRKVIQLNPFGATLEAAA